MGLNNGRVSSGTGVNQTAISYSPITLSGTAIDWSQLGPFYQEVSDNTTYTFSNSVSGQTIVVLIKNTAGTTKTITMPTTLNADASATTDIATGKSAIFTFVKHGAVIWKSVITDNS